MSQGKFGTRLSWDQLFMKVAETVSERTSCLYHHLGVVLVDDMHRIVSVGYNGPIRGEVNCSEVGCAKIHGDPETGMLKRCRGAHGEINAIINCIQPERLRGSTLYITEFPCFDCMKAMIQVGVKEIVFKNIYRRVVSAEKKELETEAWELALKMNISLYHYDTEKDERIPIRDVPN